MSALTQRYFTVEVRVVISRNHHVKRRFFFQTFFLLRFEWIILPYFSHPRVYGGFVALLSLLAGTFSNSSIHRSQTALGLIDKPVGAPSAGSAEHVRWRCCACGPCWLKRLLVGN